ncbi:hypothetical protein [Rhodococcus sp. NPDC058514]|uniref:hypothetical protein n=1 Tax=unclassified Rhodococcus (in: high G+C Gram-positive bacteria) TaxID=192944 RepID=UPI003660A0B3
MRRRTSVIDRVIALGAGLALLAAGSLALTWNMELDVAREFWRRFDRAQYAAIPAREWWPTLLGVTCVVSLVVGVTLLVINLRRGRTSTVQIGAALGDADLSVDLGPMAVGLASELSTLQGVRSVRSAAVDDRGLQTLRVTVIADPAVDLGEFTRDAEALARSMAAALPDAPVATQVLLHLDRADQPG